jgi:hypothetical protein
MKKEEVKSIGDFLKFKYTKSGNKTAAYKKYQSEEKDKLEDFPVTFVDYKSLELFDGYINDVEFETKVDEKDRQIHILTAIITEKESKSIYQARTVCISSENCLKINWSEIVCAFRVIKL